MSRRFRVEVSYSHRETGMTFALTIPLAGLGSAKVILKSLDRVSFGPNRFHLSVKDVTFAL